MVHQDCSACQAEAILSCRNRGRSFWGSRPSRFVLPILPGHVPQSSWLHGALLLQDSRCRIATIFRKASRSHRQTLRTARKSDCGRSSKLLTYIATCMWTMLANQCFRKVPRSHTPSKKKHTWKVTLLLPFYYRSASSLRRIIRLEIEIKKHLMCGKRDTGRFSIPLATVLIYRR